MTARQAIEYSASHVDWLTMVGIVLTASSKVEIIKIRSGQHELMSQCDGPSWLTSERGCEFLVFIHWWSKPPHHIMVKHSGRVLTASTTAPCKKVRQPPVERLVSGQSWKDESVNWFMGASACSELPLSIIQLVERRKFGAAVKLYSSWAIVTLNKVE
jgi:hypothetical protein